MPLKTWIVELVVAGGLLVVALGVGIAVFVWARRWRQQLAEDTDPEETIETYRHMLEQGLLDPQEFDRIQARLEGRPDEPVTGIRPGQPPRPTDVRPGSPPPSEPTSE